MLDNKNKSNTLSFRSEIDEQKNSLAVCCWCCSMQLCVKNKIFIVGGGKWYARFGELIEPPTTVL